MSKVIVRYLTGEEKAGNLLSFNYNQPTFHLQVENEEGKIVTSTEQLKSVREIRFLKKAKTSESLLRTETIDESVFAGTLAVRLTIEFKDGSVLTGTTNKYNPNDRGFYLVPLNPADKSERIFINAEAIKCIESRKLFGKILIDQKKISEAQLKVGLDHQRKLREKKIGMILMESNLINDRQLDASLQKQKESPKMLGKILVQAGYITEEQLRVALAKQQEEKKIKLGQILVRLKFLTPNDICIALATQFKCAWIDLSDIQIPRDIATILPGEIVRKLEVIPVEKKEGVILIVATSQPLVQNIYLEVQNISPFNVELAIAYEEYISKNIDFFFPEAKKE